MTTRRPRPRTTTEEEFSKKISCLGKIRRDRSRFCLATFCLAPFFLRHGTVMTLFVCELKPSGWSAGRRREDLDKIPPLAKAGFQSHRPDTLQDLGPDPQRRHLRRHSSGGPELSEREQSSGSRIPVASSATPAGILAEPGSRLGCRL